MSFNVKIRLIFTLNAHTPAYAIKIAEKIRF